MLSLNTNISALRATRRLAESARALAMTSERLSSGQRINRASDDAAGLAVSEKLRVNSRLYTTAVRNIADGISLLNVASSTLSQQSEIIQRLIEIAEQSANGTFSNVQRESLEEEYRTLIAEFGRIGDATKFNGQALLRGTRDGLSNTISLQAGIDSSSDSIISVERANTGSMSGTINLQSLPDASAWSSWLVSKVVSPPPGGIFEFSELAAVFTGPNIFTTGIDSQGRTREVMIGLGTESSGSIYTVGFVRSLTNPDQWINTISAGDLSASVTFNSAGRFTRSITDVAEIGLTNGELASINLDLSGITISGQSQAHGIIGTKQTSAIDFSSVRTQQLSRQALNFLHNRLDELNVHQGVFGASMNRLEVASTVLQASRENSEAAQSRIRDADIASESANLVRGQITQQIAAAILAQANNTPQLVLGLIV